MVNHNQSLYKHESTCMGPGDPFTQMTDVCFNSGVEMLCVRVSVSECLSIHAVGCMCVLVMCILLLLKSPNPRVKSLSYLRFLTRMSGSYTDSGHTHKHTLLHCSLFHLERPTSFIKPQT